MSVRETGSGLVRPGLEASPSPTLPCGHDAMNGTLWPPSYADPLLERNGPVAMSLFLSAPLSEVKITRVVSMEPAPGLAGILSRAEPVEHAPQRHIVLVNEVVARVHLATVLRTRRTGNGHAPDRIVGSVRSVVRIGRVVQEERLVPGVLPGDVARQESHRIVGMTAAEPPQHIGVLAGCRNVLAVAGSGNRRPSVDMAGASPARFLRSGGAGRAVRSRREPGKVESVIERGRVQGKGQVRVIPAGSGQSVRSPVAQPDMPLSVHGSHVPVLAEHGSDRGPVRLDHGIALGAIEHPVLQPAPPRVAPREQGVTRRGATGRRGVGIRESDAHVREALHMRSVHLNLVRVACEVLVGAGVPHPHVVSHHEDDIGPLRGGRDRASSREGSGSQRKDSMPHGQLALATSGRMKRSRGPRDRHQ